MKIWVLTCLLSMLIGVGCATTQKTQSQLLAQEDARVQAEENVRRKIILCQQTRGRLIFVRESAASMRRGGHYTLSELQRSQCVYGRD